MSRNLLVTGMLVSCVLGLVPNAQAAPTDATPAPKGVYFSRSCDQRAAGDFIEGVTLLHNMSYAMARAAFQKVVDEDSDCAIGYWPLDMTLAHPVGAPAFTEFADAGLPGSARCQWRSVILFVGAVVRFSKTQPFDFREGLELLTSHPSPVLAS